MRPREFITLVGGVAAWPVAAHAQQGELVRRIGVLMGFAESDSRSHAHMAAFRDGLQKLGWTKSRRNDSRRSSSHWDQAPITAEWRASRRPGTGQQRRARRRGVQSRAQAYVFNVFGWLAEAARS